MSHAFRLAAAAFGLAALTVAAAAAEPAPGVAGVELIEGWRRADGAHVAAIEIRLAPGWHTYWRSPGATGLPPRFDWSDSENLAAVAYEWPRPTVFETPAGRTIGYEGALVLPVVLTPRAADAPLDAAVHIAFGVCKDVCMQAEAWLEARLDPVAAPGGRAKIEAALARRPLGARAGGVAAARCGLAPGPSVVAEVTLAEPPSPGAAAVIEAAGRPDLWVGPATILVEGRRLLAEAPLEGAADALVLRRDDLRLTLLDGDRAIDIRGCAGR